MNIRLISIQRELIININGRVIHSQRITRMQYADISKMFIMLLKNI